jgi:8-hydroxy-5-deazaflavin:NADPH oxidoreductase
MTTKKIGIIGSGDVGKALAVGFLKNGYQVMLGTRSPEKLKEWREKDAVKAQIGSFEETAKFGETIVLAVKGTIAGDALKLAGEANLKGKTIIDASNPIADLPPQDGVLKFFTTLDSSLMEKLQADFPQANFVKAFSCVGSVFMVNPPFKDKPTMFICGNNAAAKSEVSEILGLFGWETADMGTATAARAIEPLCILWCIPGFNSNSWTHAFKLVKL